MIVIYIIMTIAVAFNELILNQPEWYTSIGLNKTDGEKLYTAFMGSGNHTPEIKEVLLKSGYNITEEWCKTIPRTVAGVPGTKSVYDDMNESIAFKSAALASLASSKLELALMKQADTPLGNPEKL